MKVYALHQTFVGEYNGARIYKSKEWALAVLERYIRLYNREAQRYIDSGEYKDRYAPDELSLKQARRDFFNVEEDADMLPINTLKAYRNNKYSCHAVCELTLTR